MYAGTNLCQYCEHAIFLSNSFYGKCFLHKTIITMICHCKSFKDKQVK